MSAQIVKTAFDRPQRELGCEFMDWEGWYWPSHFGDAVAEHHAVRTDVGVWDASPLRKWDFRGRDALAAADRIFTNDMLSLDVGQVRYAPFCDEAGKMVGDGTVFKHAEDYCTVVTALDSDLDHFHEVVAGLDVAIEPITENLPHVQLQGPRSRDVLAGLCDRDVHGLGYFRFWPDTAAVGRVPCRVSRTGYSGELGFEIFCEAEYAEDLWAVLTGAGARPYGLSAVETLRIESGLVFIGYDYFQHETNPFDVGLDKLIRLDTGDFHGKPALVETAKAPPRRFVTLAIEGGVPEYGAAVTVDGAPAGTLTSPCESPTLGGVIGMAVLETPFAGAGTNVDVAVGDGVAAPATVTGLPIYDPGKAKPRS